MRLATHHFSSGCRRGISASARYSLRIACGRRANTACTALKPCRRISSVAPAFAMPRLLLPDPEGGVADAQRFRIEGGIASLLLLPLVVAQRQQRRLLQDQDRDDVEP